MEMVTTVDISACTFTSYSELGSFWCVCHIYTDQLHAKYIRKYQIYDKMEIKYRKFHKTEWAIKLERCFHGKHKHGLTPG
jgi:hypothetical protein